MKLFYKKCVTWLLLCTTALILFGCVGGSNSGNNAGSTPITPASKSVLSYSFQLPSGAVVSALINGQNITATVPYGTDVTHLVATFKTTGTSVQVGDVPQKSGVTENDFTKAVVYKVTYSDGSWQNYTVTVTVASSSAKEITAFSLNGTAGIITGTNIAVTMPSGTPVESLVATFTTTGASVTVESAVQSSGTTVNDFTNPVIYRVTAANGTTQDYTVTVTVASNTAKEITAFSLNGTPGTITGQNIAVIMPYSTNVESLVATFTYTGASVTVDGTTQASGTTTNDFTNPVTYTVTAADGTTQNYTVTVTVALNPAKEITAFSLNGVSGTITGTSIVVAMSQGTDVESLVATFTYAGSSITVDGTAQVSGTTANDFTSPVTYTVTAADGTTQDYIVTVKLMTHRFAYITNNISTSYTQCNIDPSTGNFINCSTVTPSSPGALNGPSDIVINNGFAYFSNPNNDDDSYTQCSIDTSTGNLGNCNTIVPQAPGALAMPDGIAIHNGFAYIVNQVGSSYTQCTVEPNGSLSNCNNIVPSGKGALDRPAGITISNDFAYIMNNNAGSYTQCSVESTGNLSGCTTTQPVILSSPTGITINNGFAYIINSSSNSYTLCTVGTSDGNLSNCNTVRLGALNKPQRIAISDGFAYITNFFNNSYTQCTVDPINGNLSNCNTLTPSGAGALYGPMGITFY